MNKKKGLDELQLKQRNSAGNQMFMLMFYAFFLEAGLYGLGVRWLNYPANIITIISVCMGIYLVRLFINNAYLSPSALRRNKAISLVMAFLFLVALIATGIFLFYQREQGGVPARYPYILIIVFAVGLLCSLIVCGLQQFEDKH